MVGAIVELGAVVGGMVELVVGATVLFGAKVPWLRVGAAVGTTSSVFRASDNAKNNDRMRIAILLVDCLIWMKCQKIYSRNAEKVRLNRESVERRMNVLSTDSTEMNGE